METERRSSLTVISEERIQITFVLELVGRNDMDLHQIAGVTTKQWNLRSVHGAMQYDDKVLFRTHKTYSYFRKGILVLYIR